MPHLNDAKLDSLWTSFEQKPQAGVCSTFAFATETTIEELKTALKTESLRKALVFGSCLEEMVRRKGNYC